jgi:hypothetical protein
MIENAIAQKQAVTTHFFTEVQLTESHSIKEASERHEEKKQNSDARSALPKNWFSACYMQCVIPLFRFAKHHSH